MANGINPNPVKGTRPLPNEVGTVFPHLRLPPSGPVLPGGQIVQVGFDQAIFTGVNTDSYKIPVAQPNPFNNKIPRDVTGNATFPFVGVPMGVTLKSVKKGNVVMAWLNFGVSYEAAGSATVLELSADDGAGNNPLVLGGAIQTAVPTAAGTVMGCIYALGINPFLQTQDIRLFPLAADSVGTNAFVIPAINQVSLIAMEIEVQEVRP